MSDSRMSDIELPPKRCAAKAGLVFLALTLCAPFAYTQVSRMAAGAELTNSLAVTAAIWGAPLVTMFNLRYNVAVGPTAKAAPNSIWREADISTPQIAEEAGYVTPNVNTVYGFGFLDLGSQPQALSVPDSDGRYYVVEIVDMWTNAFAYVGGVETGYKGGTFVLVGPGWRGPLPEDVRRIDCPTRWVMIQPRVHVSGPEDLAVAEKVLQAITVKDLAAFMGQPASPAPAYAYIAPDRKDPKLPVSALDYRDPLQFWDILSAAMKENPPPPDQLSALVPLFAPLGLTPGRTWDRTEVNPFVLQAMAKAAADIGPILAALDGNRLRNGWEIPPSTMGDFGTDYLTRAVVARNGLSGNTPKEAIYYLAYTDSVGGELSGSHGYTLTFRQTPPVVAPGFWSVTLYDADNYYPISNPINRYSLGSDNPGMHLNPDGSLTIYLQRYTPGTDKVANWLPCPPGRFFLALRAYAPAEAMVRSLTDPAAYEPPIIAVAK
jgi:DNA sulfur modification protein DndE